MDVTPCRQVLKQLPLEFFFLLPSIANEMQGILGLEVMSVPGIALRTTAYKVSCVSLVSRFPDHMIAGNKMERKTHPQNWVILKLTCNGELQAANHLQPMPEDKVKRLPDYPPYSPVCLLLFLSPNSPSWTLDQNYGKLFLVSSEERWIENICFCPSPFASSENVWELLLVSCIWNVCTHILKNPSHLQQSQIPNQLARVFSLPSLFLSL